MGFAFNKSTSEICVRFRLEMKFYYYTVAKLEYTELGSKTPKIESKDWRTCIKLGHAHEVRS